MPRPSSPRTVAVIGAGPGGLVAARWLRHVGFAPVLFEQGDGVGGQWRVGSPFSSIWPGMRTNTSRVMTAFGDAPHPPGTAAFPAAEEIGAYLERYAERYGLLERARFAALVETVERDEGAGDGAGDARWAVRWRDARGTTHDERFAHVVVAAGRHHAPVVPRVEGIDGFTGALGAVHARAYRGAERYRGRRVLVAGHAISATEIASALALEGAARVIVAARRHRFVAQRMLAGVPMDHRFYRRYDGLAWESLPPAALADEIRALVLRTSGHPSQFGAPVHSENVLDAGLTHSPFYLQLVAEGRITPRSWIARVDGDVARLADGGMETIDGIVFCTGYALAYPFLGPSVRAALQPDGIFLDLHAHTFHPDLPGLAFVGAYEHAGPFFSTLEQQARWVAYAWSGVVPAPSRDAMLVGVAAARTRRGGPHVERMHMLARRFARECGAEPDPARWPTLARALVFGPLSPASFRLEGPDALPDAASRVRDDAAAFGSITDDAVTAEELRQLRAVASARGDVAFSAFVDALTAASVPGDAPVSAPLDALIAARPKIAAR